MNDKELIARYRNLLIALSRMYTAVAESSRTIQEIAKSETMNGRKAGLNCKANSLAKTASKLSKVIYRNKAALRYFFNTTDLDEVADKEIEYSDPVLTDLQQQLPSSSHDDKNKTISGTPASWPISEAEALRRRRRDPEESQG